MIFLETYMPIKGIWTKPLSLRIRRVIKTLMKFLTLLLRIYLPSLSNTIHGKEGAYLTHVTPKGGDAKALADEIFKTMESFKICDSVVGILGDGCAKNTRAHRGVIMQLEEKLCRPLAHLSVFIIVTNCHSDTYLIIWMGAQVVQKHSMEI